MSLKCVLLIIQIQREAKNKGYNNNNNNNNNNNSYYYYYLDT